MILTKILKRFQKMVINLDKVDIIIGTSANDINILLIQSNEKVSRNK